MTTQHRADVAAAYRESPRALALYLVHELRNALPPVRHDAERIEGPRAKRIQLAASRLLSLADALAEALETGEQI